MRAHNIQKAGMARSSTSPAETAQDESKAMAPVDSVERPAAIRRASAITFAPPPVDKAVAAPRSKQVPTLTVASISAVTRNFVVLAMAHGRAQPQQADAEFDRMARTGSRMFADYLKREADSHPEGSWAMKGIRAINNRLRHDVGSRGTMLGELTALRPKLASYRAFIDEADDRRNLIFGDVNQFLNGTFDTQVVARNAHMLGVVLGCMLSGATMTLDEAWESPDELATLGPTLVAFGNALEKAFGVRGPAALSDGVAALQFWREALDGQRPQAILERYEGLILQQHRDDPAFMGGFDATRAAVKKPQ